MVNGGVSDSFSVCLHSHITCHLGFAKNSLRHLENVKFSLMASAYNVNNTKKLVPLNYPYS